MDFEQAFEILKKRSEEGCAECGQAIKEEEERIAKEESDGRSTASGSTPEKNTDAPSSSSKASHDHTHKKSGHKHHEKLPSYQSLDEQFHSMTLTGPDMQEKLGDCAELEEEEGNRRLPDDVHDSIRKHIDLIDTGVTRKL